MKYRSLGKTGLKVSEVGFGCWGIGGQTNDGPTSYGKTDDQESLKSLKKAYELGINFYDTANIYGYGHSEKLIGKALGNYRDKIFIASKVGFKKHNGPHNFRKKYLQKELEKSLKRLKTDYLDIYQLHSPPIELLRKNNEAVETVLNFKKEGKIRVYGISVKAPADAIPAIKEFKAETVQINFNLIDQRVLETGFFDLAKIMGVGIIIRTPLAFGFLSGKVTNINFSAADHRSAWAKNQLKIWRNSPNAFELINNSSKKRTMCQFAIKFCLDFTEVSSVIPGMITQEQVEENAATSELANLTKKEIRKIQLVYQKNKFFTKK